MSEIRIVNAAPLITLAKAGLHDLLTVGAAKLRIPFAVVAEISTGPVGDPARNLLASGWGGRCPGGVTPQAVLEWGLGAGESAVIAVALETPNAVAVLDDAAARRCARSLGVTVRGTLGIILSARRELAIPAAAPAFVALRDAGLYFDDELARQVLAAVGEARPAR